MLIATAHTLLEAGHDPASSMFFVATDLSRLSFNMAYLQTSILGLSGLVRHGNTLSNEVWDSRLTPICRVFPWRTRRVLDSLTFETEESATPGEALTAAHDNARQEVVAPEVLQPTTIDKPDDLTQAGKNYEQGRLF
ncbi:MAG: hypothetical protein R2867_02635 [Caldilineaceae bacterium]